RVREDEIERLAGGVDRELGGPHVPRERRHEHDPASSVPDHRRREHVRQEQRRSTVDVEHRVELRGLELEERRDDATGGGEDDEPDRETGDRLADRVDEVGTGEIERDGPYLDVARGADLGGGALEGLAVPVEKDEVEAMPGDLPRPLGPETERG